MYLSSIYPQFFRAEKSYAFRQNLVLDGEHTRGQRFRGVALQHGDALLHNHAAVIDLLIDKVRRRAGNLRAVGQNRLVHVMAVHPRPAERRNQRRMDVDDPVLKRPHNLPPHDGQIARQHDEIGVHRAAFGG